MILDLVNTNLHVLYSTYEILYSLLNAQIMCKKFDFFKFQFLDYFQSVLTT